MDYITHNMEWEIDPKLIFLTIPDRGGYEKVTAQI